jgi:hypothetical protein
MRAQIAQLKSPMNVVIDTHKPMSADSQNFQLQNIISKLRHENDCFQAENSKVKQHYKELYDSIKITRDKTNENITSLLNEIENLKTKVKGKMPVIASDNINSKVCECKKYACEVVLIPLSLKNNELVHSDYLRHLKNCLDMTHETIEEDRMVRPSDNTLSNICFLTKRSQELLEYAIGTCPKIPNMRYRKGTSSSRNLKNHVTFDLPSACFDHSTSPSRNQTSIQQSNVPIIQSTGVSNDTKASGSMPKGNTRNDRTSATKSAQGKKVEDHLRNNKIDLSEKNRVDSSICFKHTVFNSNSNATCKTCNGCLISSNHDDCVVSFLKSSYKSSVKFANTRKLENHTWKATGKVFTNVGYQWRPTRRKFTLGNQCPLTNLPDPKLLVDKKWKATGRKLPLVTQCLEIRSVAPTSIISSEKAIVGTNPASLKYACANQLDPSYTWGSMFFSYPYLSGFKYRSYKSSYGIWTQAAQNI